MTPQLPDKFPEEIAKILTDFNVTQNDLNIISKRLRFEHLKKGDIFCKCGKTCDKLGLLIKGLLMAKFDTENGKFNVSRFFFSPDNMIVTSFESFKSRKPADESIIALDDSILIYLTFSDIEQLYTSIPSLNKVARHFAEQSYITALGRIHDLQVLNNEKRIEKFYKKNRELYNKINKIHIASYLGVNRNDLTKIIAKLNKQKR
jgi:CRP/FNR family transcriptional regulator, anaerobic regulatory protein